MKNALWYNTSLVCTFLICSLVAGCSGGEPLPELVEVTGTVTMDGNPLSEAKVIFQLQGHSTPDVKGASSGTTDSAGHYTLYYGPEVTGAVPGNYLVSISKMEGAGVETIPDKYNARTSLKANVTKAGTNAFDFELKSKE